MRFRCAIAWAIAVVGLAAPRPTHGAEAVDEAARRRAVVARVSDLVLTVGEVEDRLGALPAVQLSMFGRTAPEIARKFVDEVLLREMLLAAGAHARHLDA